MVNTITAKPVDNKGKDFDIHIPDDLHVPDNYVEHVLKTQKALPPITLSNWYKELNTLNCGILLGTPLLGLIGAFYTKLRWETAIFAVLYYFFTGLGEYHSLRSRFSGSNANSQCIPDYMRVYPALYGPVVHRAPVSYHIFCYPLEQCS